MKIYTILIIPLLVYTDALECGIKTLADNSMKNAVSMCLSRNNVRGVNDFSTISPKVNGTPEIQKEEDNKINSTSSREMKTRKGRSSGSMKFNRQVSETTTTNQPEVETEATTVETFAQDENCVLQCILSRMNLTNEKGFPDQEKISHVLTKNVKGRELKDFLVDTTENCFVKMKEDSSTNSCDSSKKLLRCLADGGKSNCGDWPAGEISLLD